VALDRGGRLASEGRKREVVQLLKDYQDWHAAFGGAGEINLQALGQYGPAGMIFKGMAFDPKQRGMLEESFDLLEKALTLLKGEHFEVWLLLHGPYIGDPGDPALVEQWREKRPGLVEWHDFAIEKLATYLKDQDLYVAWPARMATRREKHVERMNDEFYSLYQKLIKEGERKTKVVQTAAEWCGYGPTRAWEIVRIRESSGKT
jgi:hypothetical protein